MGWMLDLGVAISDVGWIFVLGFRMKRRSMARACFPQGVNGSMPYPLRPVTSTQIPLATARPGWMREEGAQTLWRWRRGNE